MLVSGANLETASSLHINGSIVLDGVPARAINQKTFNIVEQRVSEIKVEDHEDPSLIEKVKGNVIIYFVGSNVEDARLETSKSLNVPLGAVIAFTSEVTPVAMAINRRTPDWSWQEEAEQKCYNCISK